MTKKSNYIVVALFFAVMNSAIAERDPFEPLKIEPCVPDETLLSGWHLRGIVGDEPHWRAWVEDPSGRWLQLTPDALLGDTSWRVTQVTVEHVVLARRQPEIASVCPVTTQAYLRLFSAKKSSTHPLEGI